MSIEVFTRIVDNAVDSGVRRIVFTGWGEPTVNPEFSKMLVYSKKRGLYTIVNTNGLKLRDYSDLLINLEIDELYVSIDAIDLELYERIRRLGDLSIVSREIVRINKIKASKGLIKPVIKTIFTINKLNVEQISKLVDYAVETGIQEIYLSNYIDHPGSPDNMSCIEDPVCSSRLRKILEEIGVRSVNTPVKIWYPNISSYTFRSCPFISNKALYIRVDGRVSPCIYMAYSWESRIDNTKRSIREVIIGDALRERLVDIWWKNRDLLFKLYFNYMPSCLDCNLRYWCKYTMSNESDCWGNTPNCSFCPYHYKLSYCPL